METLRITFTLTFLIILFNQVSFAQQSIKYHYDASGNRQERNTLRLSSTNQEDTTFSQNTNNENIRSDSLLVRKYGEILGPNQINLYPNPNGGQFDVQITNLEDVKNAEITLYSMTGEPILIRKDPDELEHFNVSALGNGTYLLTIILDDRKTTWKIIKQ